MCFFWIIAAPPRYLYARLHKKNVRYLAIYTTVIIIKIIKVSINKVHKDIYQPLL